MPQKNKVLVIGLDGANWELLDRLMEKGEMPNLKKIIGQGIKAKLRSVIPPSSGPLWTSFVTGKYPNNHGCYDFLLPGDDLETFHPISSHNIKGKTFYEILEQNNLKSIIVNLPNSYPPRLNLNKSIMITSLMTKEDNFVFPESLKSKIPLLKEYRLLPDMGASVKGDEDKSMKITVDLADMRFRCAKELFKLNWDFFFLLFIETDWIQHSRYDKLLKGEDEISIQLFKNIDNYLGWFLKNKPKNCFFIIMSDHGFKLYKGIFFINKWLEDKGFLKTKNKVIDETPPTRTQKERIETEKKIKKFFKMGSLMRKIFYSKAIYRTAKFFYRKFAFRFFSFHFDLYPDLVKTKAISPNNTDPTFLYINDYRFQKSTVKTQIEKDKLINQIISKLKNLYNKEGEKVLKDVKKVNEVYKGNIPKKFPDIILGIDKYLIQQDMFSPTILKESIQSSHSLESVLILHGNGIKKGILSNASLIDLAPTILNLFHLPIPKDIDGKVLNVFKSPK